MTKGSKLTEQIWRRYHNKLLAFIKSKVNDQSYSEDILQDVFIKIHNKIDELNDNEKLSAWIFQITKNTIIDYYRQNKILEELPQSLQQEEKHEEQSAMKDVELFLSELILNLPPKYKEAIILSELKGIKQKDLADRIDISYSGVKSRVQRGRTMLKDSLTECCHYTFDKYGTILSYESNVCKCKNC